MRYLATTMETARALHPSLLFGNILGLLVAITAYTIPASAALDDADTTGANSTSANEKSAAPDAVEENGEKLVSNSKDKKTYDGSPTLSHKGQFSLRLGAVAGYRIVMRYDDSPQCDKPDSDGDPKTFCGFGAPLGLETAVGYAPIAGVEPFLWGRFGLREESKTHTAPLLVFGAGVRLYTMSEDAFKFFIEPAIGAELEGRSSGGTDATGKSDQYKQDWLLRLHFGPQYDFNRYLGLYASAGMTVGMVRALNAFMEVQVGLQARIP